MESRVLTWEEIAKEPQREVPYLLDPYIPEEGDIFIYGDTSIGKSPLSWHMARCIGEGEHFFGLPTKKGGAPVLYLEVDTPDVLVIPRLQKLPPARNVTFCLHHGNLNAPNMDMEMMQTLQALNTRLRPAAVFINTLVKAHDLDDKEPKTPSKVYGFFRGLFPRSACVYMHHVRKQDRNPAHKEFSKEAFSGSKHWIDDATVGLFLQPYRGKDQGNLRLYHTKSQVSQKFKPLPLNLEKDGSNMTSPLYDDLLTVYEMFHEWVGEHGHDGMGRLDNEVAARLGCSRDTAQRRRLLIEHGQFPGSSSFLGREEKEKDADAAPHEE